MDNAWGIVRCIIDLVMQQKDGKVSLTDQSCLFEHSFAYFYIILLTMNTFVHIIEFYNSFLSI